MPRDIRFVRPPMAAEGTAQAGSLCRERDDGWQQDRSLDVSVTVTAGDEVAGAYLLLSRLRLNLYFTAE